MAYLWLIPILPLLGAVFNGVLGAVVPRRVVSLVGCGTVGLSFALAVRAVARLALLAPEHRVISERFYTWIVSGPLAVDFTFRLDPLSAVMILVVTGVGFLIHVYSTGYMHDDPGYGKYFSFINLFLFAMSVLVLSDNLVGLFLGWEGVGLCSYLLIGFWYQDPEKASAGKKAFIVNRIGDAGFIFGMSLLFAAFGTTRIPALQEATIHGGVNTALITAACIALFIGATGKSAQLPLYVWLPDAMAGPTPVSALIHAATMVTAGVYMVARLNFLYVLAPAAMGLVAGVGVVTAMWAALIAFSQTDIKKVLAYSTVSQLGYMFVGVGVGAFTAGIFHLMTHAFFKACLFLASGAVIHYLHGEQEITKMGGLRKMPGMTFVFWPWIAATLAISGLPFITSGFYSKDEILWFALASERGATWIYAIGAITAVFTAIYMWRLTILTFFGESRVDPHVAEHPHKPAWTMWSVLVALGFLSIVGGWIGIPAFLGHPLGLPNVFEHWLEPVFEHGHVGLRFEEHAAHAAEMKAFLMGLLIPVVGIAIGAFLWLKKREALARVFSSGFAAAAYRASKGKFFVDEFYEAVVIKPIRRFSENVLWKIVDVRVIDGAVNGAAKAASAAARGLRRIPSGEVQYYALAMFVGLVIILLVIR